MSFFMNPFTADFRGNWVLGDRQHQPTFICPRHSGRADDAVFATGVGPFNMSGADSDGLSSDTILLSYSVDQANFSNWVMIPVNCTTGAANIAAVTSQEVVNALNADPNFYGPFTATLYNNRVTIKQNKDSTRMRFFVVSGRAEERLLFNSKAGVAELPTYFNRHTIARRNDFPDSVGMLVLLNPAVSSQAGIITRAGFNPAVVQTDWQLLRGRSGLFQFTKVAGGTTIVYPAGAREGDLAMMTVVSGGGTFQMPYTLQPGDLITPP
jgi:hypothetical protein